MKKKSKTPAKKDPPPDATSVPSSEWRPWMDSSPSEMYRHLFVECSDLAAMMKKCSACLPGEELLPFALAAKVFGDQLATIAKSACDAYRKLEVQEWIATKEGKKAIRAATKQYGEFGIEWSPDGIKCVPCAPPAEAASQSTNTEMVKSEPEKANQPLSGSLEIREPEGANQPLSVPIKIWKPEEG